MAVPASVASMTAGELFDFLPTGAAAVRMVVSSSSAPLARTVPVISLLLKRAKQNFLGSWHG